MWLGCWRLFSGGTVLKLAGPSFRKVAVYSGFFAAGMVLLSFPVAGNGSVRAQPPDLLEGIPPDEAKRLLQWALDWGRQLLPESYHRDKAWDKQKRVYAGFNIKADDGRLSTKRRWKEVNHGRWLRYDIRLGDVHDPRRLKVQVTDAHLGEDRRLHFEARVDTRVDVHLQQQQWNLGVRLYSLSVEADARLRMEIAGDIGFELDLTRIPPDVLADPHVSAIRLSLIDLNVERISHVGGEVAESIGDLVKQIIRDEYLPSQQAKIAEKLNRQIDRRRDRLRLGASDWLSRRLSPLADPATGDSLPTP